MKYFLAFILIISFALTADFTFAQNNENNESILNIGIERQDAERNAMFVLLGWGVLNTAVGSGLAIEGSYRDFGFMTAGWGIINAGIAAFALLGSDVYTADTPFSTIIDDEAFFNRVLAINTGLNVAYITAGSAMSYWGKSSRIREFGTAVIIQGAFLFAFDSVLLYQSTDRMKRLSTTVDTIAVLPEKDGLNPIPVVTLNLRF